MKIGVVGCFHETNTFAPGITDIEDFKKEWVDGKNAFYELYEGTKTSMGGVIDASSLYGFELVPLFFTQTMPSSIVSQSAVDQISEKMLSVLDKEKDSLDCLVVILHGAMVSEDWQDVEGILLKQIRDMYGNKLIGVTIDLHANVSESMVHNSDIIVGYDTYPHIDAYERALEVCKLLVKCYTENIKPFIHFVKTNLLITQTLMNTNIHPMKTIMNKAYKYEKIESNILNITVAGGFAFADVFCAGATILVNAIKDERSVEDIGVELSDWMIYHKEEFIP